MKLRDYQREAVEAIFRSWEEHTSTLLVLPTGTGKTCVFAEIAHEWQAGRVLVIAPQIELVDQAARKIRQRTGTDPAIEQAQRRSNESHWSRSPFVVASRSTLISEERSVDRYGVNQRAKRYARLKDIGLVIIDEAHLALTTATKEIVDHYRQCGAKVLGVTATPKRHDGKAMGIVYDDCAYQLGIREAIDRGWLVAPKTHCLQIESLDLSQVGTKGAGGDFKDGELAKAMEDEQVCFEIAELTAAESRGLKTVVYCATVAEARKVACLLTDQHNFKAEFVSGNCSSDKRQQVLTSFTQDPHGVEIVCNCQVLTTGWDFPGLEHIVMARPTKSLSLYTQILGRATRPLEGVVDFDGSTAETRIAAIANSHKPHFKVTDLRDNSLHHKLITAVDVLGGDLSLDARKRAEEKLRDATDARPLGEVLEEARREQEEFERRERERLAKIRAEAKYERRAVDPFDMAQRGTLARDDKPGQRMPFGKFRGQRIRTLPSYYLNWLQNQDWFALRYPALAATVANELNPCQPEWRADVASTNAVQAKLQAMLLEV